MIAYNMASTWIKVCLTSSLPKQDPTIKFLERMTGIAWLILSGIMVRHLYPEARVRNTATRMATVQTRTTTGVFHVVRIVA